MVKVMKGEWGDEFGRTILDECYEFYKIQN
jgi:hypothetical protein